MAVHIVPESAPATSPFGVWSDVVQAGDGDDRGNRTSNDKQKSDPEIADLVTPFLVLVKHC